MDTDDTRTQFVSKEVEQAYAYFIHCVTKALPRSTLGTRLLMSIKFAGRGSARSRQVTANEEKRFSKGGKSDTNEVQ